MNKKLLASALFAMSAGSLLAAPISPDAALSRLANAGGKRLAPSLTASPVLVSTLSDAHGKAAVYLFSNIQRNGYMILSADDAVVPMLGYSDEGRFDENNIAPAFEYWLNEYVRQIEYARSEGLLTKKFNYEGAALPEWDPIEPLVKSEWDQGAPYNADCPKLGNYNCYTGCVATSMAQIMRYHRFPEKGQGTITYEPYTLNQKLSLNFANITFDYDNMIDRYDVGKYNSAQAAAVAKLMQAAGYSVQMMYSTDVSGALSALIAGAMVNYFNYDEGIYYYDRSQYTYNDWAQMLYNDLSQGQPLIYDGTAPNSGGHSFICDGYNGEGMFHFNWGWSGMSNGYYILDALNPSSIGIGGYAGGFNFDQDCVMGIKPSESGNPGEKKPLTLHQYGSLFANVNSNNSVSFGVENSNPYLGFGYNGLANASFTFGLIFEPVEGEGSKKLFTFSRLRAIGFESGSILPYNETTQNYFNAPLTNVGLEENVKYKATMAFRDATNSSSSFIPVTNYIGFPNYVYITQTGDSFEVENIAPAKYSASDLEILTDSYFGCPVKAKATITNNTEYQLSRGVCLLYVDGAGEKKFMGDSFFLTLNPGESIDKEWISVINAINANDVVTQPTEFTVYLYDLDTNMVYDVDGIPVTMQPNPGTPTMLTTLTLKDTPMENGYYIRDNGNNMEFEVSLRIARGTFIYPVSMHIMELRGNAFFSLIRQAFDEVPFLSEGEYTTLYNEMNFENPNPGQIYYLQTSYSSNGRTVWMNNQTTIRFGESGVESVSPDDKGIKFYHDRAANTLTVFAPEGCESINGYFVNGMAAPLNVEHFNGYSNIDLSNLGTGILILNVVDKNGKTATQKIAL